MKQTRVSCSNSSTRAPKVDYSQFPLFEVAMVYKVLQTPNTEFGSYMSLVTFVSTSQHITLCMFLTSYVLYIFDALTLNSHPTAL